MAEEAPVPRGGPAPEEAELSQRYVKYLRLLSSTWSTASAARLLDADLLRYIEPRFVRCSTPLKVRVVVSLLHMKDTERVKCASGLKRFLQQCELDSEDWVRKLSRLLLPYVETGVLDASEVDTEFAYRTLQFLDERKEEKLSTYYFKEPLHRPYVFDALNDQFYPITVYPNNSSGFNGNNFGGGNPFQAWPSPHDQRHPYEALPPKLASYLLTQPHAPIAPHKHFVPQKDLSAVGNNLCAQGLALMTHNWQVTLAMANRRSAAASISRPSKQRFL